MPQVFDNANVAHVWAQQNQSEGRSNNGNFWFSGSVLYSYRTPIARMFHVGDLRVALITTEHYSRTTTGKHMPALHRAVDYGRGSYRAFRVPFIGATGGQRSDRSGNVDHVANLAHLETAYGAYIEHQSKSRSKFRAEGVDITKELIGIANRVQEYARLFDLPTPVFDVKADTIRIEQAREEYDTPEAKARRAASAKKRRDAERKQAEERLEAWRAGAHIGLPEAARRDSNGGAHIRIRGDVLETSLGATVPLEHAVKAFRFVKLCRERGVSWQRNGKVVRVGHYQLDSIDAAGNFVAGCHRFSWPEIERAAVAAGVFEAPADDSAVEVRQ